jgi:hypothetical protein
MCLAAFCKALASSSSLGGTPKILAHPDLAPIELQHLYLLPVLLAARHQPDGWLIARSALVLFQPAQIELHLALVDWIKAAQLQLYAHQAAQAAVIEKPVQVDVPAADGHALLAGDKCRRQI